MGWGLIRDQVQLWCVCGIRICVPGITSDPAAAGIMLDLASFHVGSHKLGQNLYKPRLVYFSLKEQMLFLKEFSESSMMQITVSHQHEHAGC